MAINGRTIVAPAAAATMALLLLVHTRRAIHEARRGSGVHGERGLKTAPARAPAQQAAVDSNKRSD